MEQCKDQKILNGLTFNSCSFDSVAIYDGASTLSPILGKFCGSSIPLNQISGSNEVSIHFKTDGSMTGTGFQLEYSASSKLMIFLLQ